MTGVLDEALTTLSRTAPEFENGNTNHAPMVAETLDALGHGARVGSWLDQYRHETAPPERPSQRPAFAGDWREYLGKKQSWPEWVAVFGRQLGENRWQDVLEAWLPRLAPGLSGSATHGLIKTAHAARALGRQETEPRLAELADGLAYWAATYHAFSPGPAERTRLRLDEALTRVPRLQPDTSGNIDDALRQLGPSREFAPVVNLLATGPDPLADLSQLTQRFASVFLRNAGDPSCTFAVVHAVTGPSSLRLLAPHVSRSTQELLFLYVWQAAAAIYCIWGKDRSAPEVEGNVIAAAELTEASLANGSAHAIKFVEACMREYEYNPAPVYLAAAAEAASRLES